MEPHWIKSCEAGVTHHLPGLQLDEGWLCSNMVHKRLWHCLAAGLDLLKYGVSITRYVVNLLSVARHPINYLLSVTLIYQGDTGTLLFRAWRIPPSGVPSYGCFQFFCQLPSNLCVFIDIAFRNPHSFFCQPPFDYLNTAHHRRGALSTAEQPIAAPHMS